LNIKELAELLDGQFYGSDSSVEIRGVNSLHNAAEGEASFLANMKYKGDLSDSAASVILVALNFSDDQANGKGLIKVNDPYLAFARLQRYFHPSPLSSGERHPTAVIDPAATLADDVDVGPHVVIEEDVTVGSGTIIHAGSVIEKGVSIGQCCIIHARAVVSYGSLLGDRVILQSGAVIGSDGFGYAWS
jgi:UDP-3-O-[3-hydroxymyristoyl] glucosamine N-acyltransferase